MKLTGLILPGIIIYAIYKNTKQPVQQPAIQESTPFRFDLVDKGTENQLYRTRPITSSMSHNIIEKRQPSDLHPGTELSNFGLSDAKIEEICRQITEKVFQKPALPSPSLPAPNAGLVKPDKNMIEATKWLEIIKHPSEVLILGKRGSGKSSLVYRIAEHLQNVAPVYVVAFPNVAQRYLPDWIGVVPTLEKLPNDCIAIVDEAYILYHARSSMTTASKDMSSLINLSRQKRQTILFVSQESKQIDRNIVSGADVIIFKEPGMLQADFERSELHKFTGDANKAFQAITDDRRKLAYVIDQGLGEIGLVEISLPTFWTSQLSRAFSYVGDTTQRPAKDFTLAERIEKAKEYHKQGLSFNEIGVRLGVSKATIKNYLDGYPYKK